MASITNRHFMTHSFFGGMGEGRRKACTALHACIQRQQGRKSFSDTTHLERGKGQTAFFFAVWLGHMDGFLASESSAFTIIVLHHTFVLGFL